MAAIPGVLAQLQAMLANTDDDTYISEVSGDRSRLLSVFRHMCKRRTRVTVCWMRCGGFCLWGCDGVQWMQAVREEA